MFDKVKSFFRAINWTRVKFVLTHALVGGVVTGIAALVHMVFGLYGTMAFAAYSWLKGKEVGEVIGKLKEAGTFQNTLKGNIDAFKSTFSTKWKLWQAEGAVLVMIVIYMAFKVLT